MRKKNFQNNRVNNDEGYMGYISFCENFYFSFLQVSCPPVMAFHLGSLGFLTAFRFQDFRTKITTILEGKKN